VIGEDVVDDLTGTDPPSEPASGVGCVQASLLLLNERDERLPERPSACRAHVASSNGSPVRNAFLIGSAKNVQVITRSQAGSWRRADPA
jgi:hypothetical protein